MTMRTRLIGIGRSKGIRLSSAVLKAAEITDEVEITVENGRITLARPGWHPRRGWAESIKAIGPDHKEEDIDWESFEWPEAEVTFASPQSSEPSPSRKAEAAQPSHRRR